MKHLLRSQAHLHVAQTETKPKPAKELADPNARQTGKLQQK